ncbi:hypothetical protein BDW22DRAFT_1430857 [Trametopsis cervina]|nr:hypothetical protein BDW22DRAFT_1430857 [Trametopsis cervina]
MTRLVGWSLDQERIIVLGDLLSKQALQWYNAEVRAPERKQRTWTLLGVVYALQERFVHKATAQLASERYKRVRFNATTGVAGLSNEIMKHADRMVQPPDAYSLRKKFMGALPQNIATHLILVYKLTAENSTYSNLLKGAIEVENGNQAMELYHRTHDSTAWSERAQSTRTADSTRPRDQQRAHPPNESRTDVQVNKEKDRRLNQQRPGRQQARGQSNESQYPRPSILAQQWTNPTSSAGTAKNSDTRRVVPTRPHLSTHDDESGEHTLETAEEQQPLEGHHYEGDYLAEGYDEYQEGAEDEEDEASHLDFYMMHADHSSTDEEVSYWAAVEDLDLSALMLGPATDAELLAESEHGAIVPRDLEADLRQEHERLNQAV